jgi:O-antigen ligase
MKPERTNSGWLHWVLPLMIALGATDVLLSQRNLSLIYAELAGLMETARHPAMPWLQRGVSLVLLVICAERISAHFASRRPVPSVPLAWAYVAFWAGSVAAPALLGAHREVSHEFLYTLVIGFAALIVTTGEIGRIVDRARDTLFILMLASVALIAVWPTLVLDESYTQGLLPGMPRLGGLAPHPVAMGMFAQLALLLVWARPYGSRWLGLLAWALGLGVLFIAQSKTAWIGFALCALVMLVVRHGPSMWRRLSDPREGGAFGIGLCLLVMVLGAASLVLLLFVDVTSDVSDFFATEQGAQLMSLTGRDQIWAIAWEEWNAHKIFGYGPGLFDDEFRLAIHMPNATNAHNQFMDTLARSGSVGALVLLAYAAVLFVLSLKYARRTGGLSAALFLALALRSISEVPLNIFGYGTEFFSHMLLVVTLAAAASLRVQATQPRPRPVYGMAA